MRLLAFEVVARVVDSRRAFLCCCRARAHVETRVQAVVARVRVGDALWVHEHAVMFLREIHHIAWEVS